MRGNLPRRSSSGSRLNASVPPAGSSRLDGRELRVRPVAQQRAREPARQLAEDGQIGQVALVADGREVVGRIDAAAGHELHDPPLHIDGENIRFA